MRDETPIVERRRRNWEALEIRKQARETLIVDTSFERVDVLLESSVRGISKTNVLRNRG